MRVRFFASDKPREQNLARAVVAGLPKGWSGDIVPAQTPVSDAYDIACVFGVKMREHFAATQANGQTVLYFDKGYTRGGGPKFYRVAVNAHQPTAYLMREAMPHDRMQALHLVFGNHRGDSILIAGASEKYHAFMGLPDPTTWARQVIQRIRMVTDRPVIYRPKPSWRNARPIAGVEYSKGRTIGADMQRARVLVTHGSNAGWDAVLAGVPCIALGASVAAPISTGTIGQVESLSPPQDADRRQWAANVAYCQWCTHEFQDGSAWRVLKRQIAEVSR